jgi:hypothetical protein
VPGQIKRRKFKRKFSLSVSLSRLRTKKGGDMKKFKRLVGVVAVIALLCLGGTAIATTVVVTPGNMDGWAFYTTDSSGIIGTGTGVVGQMVTGPSTPPLGTGSANFNLGANGDQSVQLRNSTWAGTRIDALTSLEYSTYATSWNGQQVPYLTIWLDTNGDGLRDDRLWFEPDYSSAGAGNNNPNPQAGTALNTWQTWNLLTGMWYSDNVAGPGSNAITLAAYLALKPNATIINDAAQGIGGIRLASGFASPGDNFNAYADAFTIGTASITTTYNFELTPAVPEPATLLLMGFGSGIMGAGIKRLRKKLKK